MRRATSLSSGLPGTIGVAPESAGLIASSRKSSRNSPWRAFLSGPWQWKHVSDRIGRTSRLNSIFAGIGRSAARRGEAAIANDAIADATTDGMRDKVAMCEQGVRKGKQPDLTKTLLPRIPTSFVLVLARGRAG